MIKYRDHRGSLSESMETVREFAFKQDLIVYLQSNGKQFNPSVDYTNITIEPYGYDERIDWDTYIVQIDDYCVLGFTNGRFTTSNQRLI